MSEKPVYALDFETTYSDELSVSTQGIKNYARATETFLISVVGSDGFEYVGPPEDFDFTMLNDCIVCAHNASFDAGILRYSLGFDDSRYIWKDTAALSTYLQCGRSLKNASHHMLDKEISKQARDAFKGFDRAKLEEKDLFGESMATLTYDYCLWDSKLSLEIWLKYSHLWPESEQEISRLNWECGHRGISVDVPLLDKFIKKLEEVMKDSEALIPWRDQGVLSATARDQYLTQELKLSRRELPSSFAADDDEFIQFCELHQVEALDNLKLYHRANTALKKYKAIKNRIDPETGRMPVELLYGGAPHTMRFAGAYGVNMQNLPRDEFAGTNMRNIFTAAPGKKMIIADYSAIEGVVLSTIVGSTKALDLFRAGRDYYECQAVAAGLYDENKGPLKEVDPKLRYRMKVQSLGCQYRMGGNRLGDMINDNRLGKELVTLFRESNPNIVRLWSKLEDAMRSGLDVGFWEMPLPSGRRIRYTNIHERDGKYGKELLCQTSKDKNVRPIHGGLLVENMVQGIARDVLTDAMLKLGKHDGKSFNILLHIHDEIVFEADEAIAEAVADEIKAVMETSPQWLPALPLRVDPSITDRFEK